jgi:hypothetical protein
MTGQDITAPTPSAELRRLVAAELSLTARLGYVLLLLAALTMTTIVTALWLTEPVLPVRARIAFAVLDVIGASWMVFALWVLTRRRALFARDSVIAGRMAVTFSSVFVVGALATGAVTGDRAPFAAAALGVVMVAVAAIQLSRANRAVARLRDRREALEREIARVV